MSRLRTAGRTATTTLRCSLPAPSFDQALVPSSSARDRRCGLLRINEEGDHGTTAHLRQARRPLVSKYSTVLCATRSTRRLGCGKAALTLFAIFKPIHPVRTHVAKGSTQNELEDSSHQSLRKYVSAVATVTFVICCRRKEKTTIWMPSSRQYKRCSIKDRLHELGFCQRAWLHC